MQAKQNYFLDENGELTTDVNKSARFLLRKGQFIEPGVATKYGFVDGALPEKKSDAPKANKAATPAAENKTVK